MILPKDIFVQNVKIRLNSRTWMTEVFSSDLSGLRNLCSLIDLIGLYNGNNLTGLNSLYIPISSKTFLILMSQSSLASK
jgi:hypothetical protein